MSFMVFVTLVFGLTILTLGAEFLVRGATRLAALAGVSSLVIGLTVVAFGTSAPELAVSLKGALGGQSDIALGNAVGSNIFNVLFILGLCALILPLRVDSQLVRLDVPIMIGVSILLMLLGLDGKLGFFDGAVLFGGIVAYTVFSVVKSRRETKAVQEEFDQEYAPPKDRSMKTVLWNLGLLAVGLFLLVAGARLFVDASITVAEALGVSQLVIGLTIVAAGTSLPEVATSVVATIRGERDIAIGNVVGSNIFNILCVLGCASMASPVNVAPAAIHIDIPVMVGVAVICLPIFFTGLLIRRWEGLVFFGLYVLYTAYLVMHASGSPMLPAFSKIALFGVIPAIALVIFGTAALELRTRARNARTP
jgi:cation:H+ antiporter